MRKQLVLDMEKRWGEVQNWKQGGCDCNSYCVRKANVKIEQSTYTERKEALIRDQAITLRGMRRSRAK